MKKLVLLLGLLSLLFTVKTFGQLERFKALYIYNFTKDVAWPDNYKQGDFIIGVLGTSPVIPELVKIAQTKTVGKQKITVKKYAGVENIDKCNVLYIPTAKSGQFAQVLQKIKNSPTLLITDKPGMIKMGACINYVDDQGKLKYEISQGNISSRSLKVTTYLISLGIPVN